MEVVHEGYLERCVSDPSSKKQYKKFYFVFKVESNSGSKVLEYYKDNNWKRNDPKGVCNVYAGYSVNVIYQSKKKYLFELVTIDRTHELLTTSESTGKAWVQILNKGLFVQSFNVTLISFPPAAQSFVKNIPSDALLKINESSVSLLGYGYPSVTWRFSAIRKYKLHNGCIVLEVGSRSVTGQGEFRFDTKDPKTLYEVLDKAVKHRIKLKGITPINNNPVIPIDPVKDKSRPTAHQRVGKQQSCEYNHLSAFASNDGAKTPQEENTYDELFSASSRSTKQRHSEPSINVPHFLEIRKRLSQKSIPRVSNRVSSTIESEEDYVMMGSSENSKTPPVAPPAVPPPDIPLPAVASSVGPFPVDDPPAVPPPPPPPLRPKPSLRVKPKEPIYGNNEAIDDLDVVRPSYLPLQSSHGFDNPYETPGEVLSDGKYVPSPTASTPSKPSMSPLNEYNHLFGTQATSPTTSEYNRLDHGVTADNNNYKNKINSKTPTSLLKTQNSFKSTSSPLKPVRRAPIAPGNQKNIRKQHPTPHTPHTPQHPSAQHLSSQHPSPQHTSPQHPSTQHPPQHPQRHQPLHPHALFYTSNSSQSDDTTCDYNQVGDIIAGEYIEYDSGYVNVAQSQSTDIYHVPRD